MEKVYLLKTGKSVLLLKILKLCLMRDLFATEHYTEPDIFVKKDSESFTAAVFYCGIMVLTV
jgi:hypothetical protein